MRKEKPQEVRFPPEDEANPLLAEKMRRRERFGNAIETLRADAARNATMILSDEAIDAEIRAARLEATPP